jgi:hypothetical protein
MSNKIFDNNGIAITSFWGGTKNGRCLYFHRVSTGSINPMVLNKADTIQLRNEINKWLKNQSIECICDNEDCTCHN